jgi:hypothetical protein
VSPLENDRSRVSRHAAIAPSLALAQETPAAPCVLPAARIESGAKAKSMKITTAPRYTVTAFGRELRITKDGATATASSIRMTSDANGSWRIEADQTEMIRTLAGSMAACFFIDEGKPCPVSEYPPNLL